MLLKKGKVALLFNIIFILSIFNISATAQEQDIIFNQYGIREGVDTSSFKHKGFSIQSNRWNILSPKDDVALDKEWTVKFNQTFSAKDIDGMVIEKNDVFIPVRIELLNDQKQAIVTPVDDYEPNESYSLRIFLNNGNRYKMNFTTLNYSIEEWDGKTPIDENMTRAELCRYFVANYNLYYNGEAEDFIDVSPQHPYYQDIRTMSGLGLQDGYPDGTFRPDGNVTRAEFARAYSLVLGYYDAWEMDPIEISDVSMQHWAVYYISAMINNGHMFLYDDGTFRPDTLVTKAMAIDQSIVRSFKSLNASVDSLKFYESGDEDIPYGQRNYRKIFKQSDTRYINYELNLLHSPPGKRVEFELDVIYYDHNGNALYGLIHDCSVESDWDYSWYSWGVGWDESGNWAPGTYTVKVFDGTNEIASSEFIIISD